LLCLRAVQTAARAPTTPTAEQIMNHMHHPLISRFIKPACVITTLISSTTLAQNGPPPAQVFLETAKLETLADARPVTGEIRSRHTAELASQVEGLALEVLIEEGDQVKQGQVVARLDAQRAQLEFERAQAQLLSDQSLIDQRQADLEQARRDLARVEELDARASAGAAQLDAARTLVASRAAELAQARADLAVSQSNLAIAAKELKDMSITAPFAGTVTSKHTEVGQWIATGDPICTIVSMTELEARIDIPQSLLPALERANNATSNKPTIEIKLPSIPVPMNATVHAVVPQADTLSRLFPVRLFVDDPEKQLRPGMSLTAMVPTGTQADLLTVSKDAILRNSAGEYVYFNNNGAAALAPITRLFSVGNRVVIRSPMIRPGVQVVIEGNERMFPTQPMIILGIDGNPPPAPQTTESGSEG
jgi:RND family efflux transporter MFP subunit